MALWIAELMILFPFALARLEVSYDARPVISYNNATIAWTTTEPAAAKVNFGLTSTNLDQSAENSSLLKKHTVIIKGLQNSTQYFYELVSTNASGFSITTRNAGNPFSLKTTQAPDRVPPRLASNITLKLPSDAQAVVEWATDEPSTSAVFYGTTQGFGFMANDGNLAKQHSLTLAVSNGTIYYFKVGMCDTHKNCINSSARTFIAGADLTPPSIEASIPEFFNNRLLTFSGKTDPLADVNVFVNNQLQRWAKADSAGSFKVIGLELSDQTNLVRLEAKDLVGNVAVKEYKVTLDSNPPVLTIKNVSRVATQQSMQIDGSVNELSAITFTVSSAKDLLAPSQVSGLTNGSLATNSVKLVWSKNKEEDLLMYSVFRNQKRITTTKETVFVDVGATIDSGKAYTYNVAAVDTNCNEGLKSKDLVVRTMAGGSVYNKTPSEVNLSCKQHIFEKSINLSGDFSESVTLSQGINNLKIEARDRAGNVAVFENQTLFDTQAPKILEDNLGMISPTYIPDVTLIGKVSEKATIAVFINNDTSPSSMTKTDDKGNFKVDVKLRRDVAVDHFDSTTNRNLPVSAMEIKVADAWRNDVRIVAIDDAGLKDEKKSSVILAQCGLGSWWKVDISKPTPNMLTPRLMIEGMDMIGLSVNISWQGGWNNGTIRDIYLRNRPLSAAEEKDWDKSWVISDIVKSTNKRQGYVMLKVLPQDPSHGKNMTMLDKEANLSNHRIGQCGVPGLGCVKVPLMLVVDFELPNYNYTLQQRHCFDVMVTIDRRIPSNMIPEAFLKASIDVLNATITIIDAVLKPLNTIKEYVFYGCAASWVIDFYFWLQEGWSCQFASAISTVNAVAKLSPADRFDKDVAQINKCDQVYPIQGDKPKTELNNQCVKCRDAIQKRLNFEVYMRWICDRIFCPSVPTLEMYIRTKIAQNPVRTIPGTTFKKGSDCAAVASTANGMSLDANEYSISSGYEGYTKYKIENDKAYSQDNSGKWVESPKTPADVKNKAEYVVADAGGSRRYKVTGNNVEVWNDGTVDGTTGWTPSGLYKDENALRAAMGQTTTAVSSISKKFTLNTAQAQKIYADYKKMQTAATGPDQVSCSGLHPPNAQCCGQEYMNEWNSACAVMNELKENVCVIAEDEAKVTELANAEDPIKCQVTWNKVAGICSPAGQVQADIIDSGVKYKGRLTSGNTDTVSNQCLYDQLNLREDYDTIYYRILPPNKLTGNTDYQVHRGYMLTTKRVAELTNKNSKATDDTPITKENAFRIGNLDPDVTAYFSVPSKEIQRQGSIKRCSLDQWCSSFWKDLEKCGTISETQALDLYNRIQEKLGHKEREYIVEPTSGFLRSIQCACIAAVTGYLTLYKNMLTAIKNCFQTILVTGDGSSGTCRAVLTVYVCDFIYDLISCVTEKYSLSGQRSASGGSIGNFFGALTSAGEGVQRSVAGRYGNSALWQSMFADKKLVHSVCLFAFTGTWDLDVSGLLNQQFSAPIKSEGFLYPCERRFMSFNPVSNPSGLTTWNYHFGVGLVAGAELNNIRLRLICSDGFTCSSSDGFENGRCDCPGKPQEITIEGLPNHLLPGEMIFDQGDIYKTKQDLQVRYDTAILEWTYIDNNKKTVIDKSTCKIGQVGGKPPAICKWDVGSLMYRCSVGVGTENWAMFKNKPAPEYPYGADAFRVGSMMQFSVDIQQQIPDAANCQGLNCQSCSGQNNCEYTKYLKVWIENQNGRDIFQYPDYIFLNSKGRYTDSIKLREIKADDFTGASSTKPVVSTGTGANPNDVVTEGDIIAANIDKTLFPFYILFSKDGDTVMYQICGDSACSSNQQRGSRAKFENMIVETAGVRIRFRTNTPSAANTKGWYVVSYQSASTADACSASSGKQTWKAHFQILDATQAGASWIPSTQVTVYNSVKQEQVIPFNAQCGEGALSAGRCTDPSTKANQFDCYCETTAIVSTTPRDCKEGKYCVDKKCVDTVGCVNDGKTILTDYCVCNGLAYSQNDPKGVCSPNQYCCGDECKDEPCTTASAVTTGSQVDTKAPEILKVVFTAVNTGQSVTVDKTTNFKGNLLSDVTYAVNIFVQEDKSLKTIYFGTSDIPVTPPSAATPSVYQGSTIYSCGDYARVYAEDEAKNVVDQNLEITCVSPKY
ncbi:MAG: hypothetical protein V1837_05670 [Candidatus Woesearchaeota archaeon]